MSLIMLIILTSCDAKKEKKEEHTAFLVTNPIKKDTSITKDYVSQIHSFRHIEIRALEKDTFKKYRLMKDNT